MKKEYKFILWDVDDTLIDFKKSEKVALTKCFEKHNVLLSEKDIEVYSVINHDYWKLLEQGKIEKEVMLKLRFEDFGKELSLSNIDYGKMNEMYQEMLGDYAVMFEDAYEICSQLKSCKKQYALTNGTIVAQHKKLRNTGLDKLFDDVFISDEVGYEKPDIRFFEFVFDRIPDFKVEDAIMIGDSLSSDMLGANNAGLDCCWFNYRNNVNTSDTISINYEVKSIKEIFEIVF